MRQGPGLGILPGSQMTLISAKVREPLSIGFWVLVTGRRVWDSKAAPLAAISFQHHSYIPPLGDVCSSPLSSAPQNYSLPVCTSQCKLSLAQGCVSKMEPKVYT